MRNAQKMEKPCIDFDLPVALQVLPRRKADRGRETIRAHSTNKMVGETPPSDLHKSGKSGNQPKVISELTQRPVSVVNTHTHWDHIGANHQFEEIACFNNSDCVERLRTEINNESLQRCNF